MKYENISGSSDEHFSTGGREKNVPSPYFPENEFAENLCINSVFKGKQFLVSSSLSYSVPHFKAAQP